MKDTEYYGHPRVRKVYAELTAIEQTAKEAEEMFIEPPETAEWETVEKDWEDSPAYQDYSNG